MELAALHPIHVHFVLAFLAAGVLFRLAWLGGRYLLRGRLAFAGPAACVLLLAGTAAAYLAVESGESASGPVEDMPGAHDAVEEHEEWAEWTFRLFAVVALLEVSALVLARFGQAGPVLAASGLLGLVGLYFLFETGEHGGTIVYSHAGGVGIRSGDPRDVERLLLAGLYQQAVLERSAGRGEESARLLEQAAARWPGDLELQLLLAESQLQDRRDPTLATATLSRLQIPREARRLRLRHGVLLADALAGSGHVEAALAALQGLRAQFPEDGAVKDRLRRLEASGPVAAPTPAGTQTPAPSAGTSPSPAPLPSPLPSPSPSPSPAGLT